MCPSESPIEAAAPVDTRQGHLAAVERAVRRMRSNLAHAWDSDLSLRALSREACYSVSHFIRVFHEVTGVTPHQFLASLRLQQAKELLEASDGSVTAIALRVGYDSVPTFTRTFRSQVGLTPIQFRERCREAVLSPALVSAFRQFARDPARGGGDVRGEVRSAAGRAGVIFVGVFPRGIPQGRPLAGRVLLSPGPFVLPRPATDGAQVLAGLMPYSVLVDPRRAVSPFVEVGRAQLPAIAGATTPAQPLVIELRPPSLVDPPVVVVLDALLGVTGAVASPAAAPTPG